MSVNKINLQAVTLFILLINWQYANCNALQNQSTIIKRKRDLNILEATEIISTNPLSRGQVSFYRYEPEKFIKNQSGRAIQQSIQLRVLTEKNDIDIDINKSVDKLKQQLVKLNYKPIVLLVDETHTSYKDALFFTENIFNTPGIRTEFWLMVFNASGVSTVTAHSRSNPKEIISKLLEGKTNAKNVKNSEGSAMFFAILKASQILPRESAIILFTNRNSIDEDVAQLSVNHLTSKFIQLNVVWGGMHPSKNREEKLLEEAVILTKGLFLLGNTSEMMTSFTDNTKSFPQIEFVGSEEMIVLRKNLHGDINIAIPIDRSLQNIDIIIEGNIVNAVLDTPTGMSVDLLDRVSVRRLSASAETDASPAHDPNRWAYVRFNTAKVTTTPVFGIWYLRANGLHNDKNGYNVTISAHTDISIQSEIVANMTRGDIHLKLKGQISKIDNISFVDISGKEIKHLPDNIIKNLKSKDYILNDSEPDLKNQLKLTENINEDTFYVKVSGTNNNGEKFSRLSYVNRNNFDNRRLPMILIETNARSELIATPGSKPKIIFQITNNYDYPVRVPLSVQDEKRMLTNLFPEVVVIGSKQTADVTVMTTVPSSSSLDFTNQITLTAYTTERAQKVAIMYITSNRMHDDYLPRLDYKFNSNCMEVPYSSCQSTYWTLELTAQDSQSGLMQVISIPSGIYSPNGYVSGTKEPVHFYYTSNCCQPETEIIAIDLNGNRRSYKLDANNANLSVGAIAAIVLGALIFLAIIIVIIVLVTKKCKQHDSLDLPRYRGQPTSSTRF